MKKILFAIVLVLSLFAQSGATAQEEGRWVDFGVFNGIYDCESSPISKPPLSEPGTLERQWEVRVDQTGTSGERSVAQFLRSTWISVAIQRGKNHLVYKDPGRVTLAQVLRQSIHLRRTAGADQWTCERIHGRWKDGTGPLFVTAEHRLPKDPERCARNLHDDWGRSWRVANSVCGVTLNVERE